MTEPSFQRWPNLGNSHSHGFPFPEFLDILENCKIPKKISIPILTHSSLIGIRKSILVENEGEYILTKIYVYGVTQAGASGGDNIKKFRPPLNRENHEKPKKMLFFDFFMNRSRAVYSGFLKLRPTIS